METTPADVSPKPKRRKLKFLLRVLAVFLVLLVVTVCLAPTLLSTQTGKGFIEGVANDNLPGSLKIGSLSLSWFSGQQINDIQLEAEGNSIKLQELSTELTLWKALGGDYNLGKTRLHNLNVNIAVKESQAQGQAQGQGQDAQTAATDEAAETHPETPASETQAFENLLPKSLIVDAELTEASITITTPGKEPVVIDNLEFSLTHVAPEDPLAFKLSGRSRQAGLSGSFTGNGELRGMFEDQDQPSQPNAQVQIAIKDLPTDGVDGLLDLGGVLSAGLGPTINVQIDTDATTESQDLNLQINCANLTTRFVGRAQDGKFTLTEAGTLSTTVTPELVQKLATSKDPNSQVRMAAPLPIKLTIERLTVPTSGFDPSKVAVAVRLETGTGAKLTGLGDADLGHLELLKLAATVATDNLAKAVRMNLDGSLAQGRDAGNTEVTTVSVNGEVSDLLDDRGQPQLDKLRLDGKVAIDGLSMTLADRLIGQEALAAELLGPRMGLIATSSFAGGGKATVKLDIQSSKMQVGTIALELTDTLALSKPAVIRATVSKELFTRFVKSDPPIELRNAVPIELTINSFVAPRPQQGEPAFQPDKTTLKATLTTGALELSGVPQLGEVIASGVKLSVGGASLSALEIASSVEVSQPDPGGALRELTGPKPLKVAVKATGGLNTKGLGATDLQLWLESPGIVGRVEAHLADGLTAVSLKEAATLRIVVTPPLLEQLGLGSEGSPKLAGPTTILVTVDKTTLPLGDSPLAGLEISGKSSVDRVTLEGDGTWSGAALHDTKVSFAFHGADGSGMAKVAGKASVPGQEKPGSLAVDAKVVGLLKDNDKASLDATVRLDGLPTAFVEALANQGGKLGLIGPTLGINATARLTGLKNSKGVVDAKVQSQHLTVDAGLNIAETIELSRPVKVRLVLTPDGYAALTADGQASPLLLKEPSAIEVTIQSLHMSQAGMPRVVNATVKADRMRFQNRATNKTVSLEGLTATAESADVGKDLQVKITGNLAETGTASGATDQRNIAISLTVGDLLTSAGEVNLDGLSTGLNAELRELPVAVLDSWLGYDGLLLAAFGKQLTVTATSTLKKMSGPLDAQLKASRARANLHCTLQDDVIRLSKPLAVELDATPELGQKLLSRLHPFLKGISTDHPIKLTVNQRGVMVPLKNFDIGRLVVPETTLDIGRVTLENDVLMQGLMALAKRRSPKQMAAWFTPAVVSVRNGRVKFTKRMDILLDKDLHLATWGSADLRSGGYQQTLAMTGPTLSKHFHLDNISPEEMFRIPIRGTTGAPRIDYPKATADLGRLKAQDAAMSKADKRLESLPPFLRGAAKQALNQITGDLARSLSGGDQTPVPPPSARPLPWKQGR